LGGYSLNLLYITVFYHRALTHGGLVLKPAVRSLVAKTGNWVTTSLWARRAAGKRPWCWLWCWTS